MDPRALHQEGEHGNGDRDPLDEQDYAEQSEDIRNGVKGSSTAEKEELTGWARCAEEVWTFEEKRMERWKDDINYLLLYAGLFSTALTGFIVPFYGFQAHGVDPTVQALAIIAVQLNIIALSVGHTNLTQGLPSPILPPSAAPAGRPLVTGVLWTIALILSLGSGAMAIIVSQWLHHHVNRGASLDRQSARLWYFRHCGFKAWHVEAIINVFPFMLQSAMAFFSVGLIVQLWNWDRTIAVIATVSVVGLVGTLMVTALIPVITAACPFESPQAWCYCPNCGVGALYNLQLTVPMASAIQLDGLRQSRCRPALHEPDDIADTHHIDRSQSPPDLKWVRDERDNGTIIVLGQISADVLSQILETSWLDHVDRRAHLERIYSILNSLLSAAPWAEAATYTRLMNLWRIPGLSQEVLERLVDMIWSDSLLRTRDIEDTQRLLTFLPYARERLTTERFLWITSSALLYSARLPPDDLNRVHSDVRGALDVVVKYFSLSGAEEVARTAAW
ncbi:predicted protein [Postia placenta Mad-698-R]|nr:predicted protein [Postia placenta Mad-698-R]